MRALSLKQPYANWVASGKKTIETRAWSTKYRGDILICASMTGADEPRGVALCLVELYGMRPMLAEDSDAACIDLYPRAQAWLLRDLRPLAKPFPVKGQLGLFRLEVDPHLLILKGHNGNQRDTHV